MPFQDTEKKYPTIVPSRDWAVKTYHLLLYFGIFNRPKKKKFKLHSSVNVFRDKTDRLSGARAQIWDSGSKFESLHMSSGNKIRRQWKVPGCECKINGYTIGAAGWIESCADSALSLQSKDRDWRLLQEDAWDIACRLRFQNSEDEHSHFRLQGGSASPGTPATGHQQLCQAHCSNLPAPQRRAQHLLLLLSAVQCQPAPTQALSGSASRSTLASSTLSSLQPSSLALSSPRHFKRCWYYCLRPTTASAAVTCSALSAILALMQLQIG